MQMQANIKEMPANPSRKPSKYKQISRKYKQIQAASHQKTSNKNITKTPPPRGQNGPLVSCGTKALRKWRKALRIFERPALLDFWLSPAPQPPPHPTPNRKLGEAIKIHANIKEMQANTSRKPSKSKQISRKYEQIQAESHQNTCEYQGNASKYKQKAIKMQSVKNIGACRDELSP